MNTSADLYNTIFPLSGTLGMPAVDMLAFLMAKTGKRKSIVYPAVILLLIPVLS
jgi:hypothetical protein